MLSTHALLHADREALVRYRTVLQAEVQKVDDLLAKMVTDDQLVARVHVHLREGAAGLDAIKALKNTTYGDDRNILTLKAAKDIVDAKEGIVRLQHTVTLAQMRNLEINRYFTLTPLD